MTQCVANSLTHSAVFAIIKSVMGFMQFFLRGFRKVAGEWDLVCLAWYVKRMAVLRPKLDEGKNTVRTLEIQKIQIKVPIF